MRKVSLISTSQIVFNADLALQIGLNEAIFLQKLAFLCDQANSGKVIGNKRWIYNTHDEWRIGFFPFWSVDTIKRTISWLEQNGMIESCQPEGRLSRRKYYSVTDAAWSVLTSEKIAAEVIEERNMQLLHEREEQEEIDLMRADPHNFQLKMPHPEQGNLHSSEQGNLHSCEGGNLPSSLKSSKSALSLKEKYKKEKSKNSEQTELIPSTTLIRKKPSTTAVLRASCCRWFRRKLSTAWSRSEEAALEKCADLGEDDIALLDWWFSQDHDQIFNRFRVGPRTAPLSLLNNVAAELGKAYRIREAMEKESTMPIPTL